MTSVKQAPHRTYQLLVRTSQGKLANWQENTECLTQKLLAWCQKEIETYNSVCCLRPKLSLGQRNVKAIAHQHTLLFGSEEMLYPDLWTLLAYRDACLNSVLYYFFDYVSCQRMS